MALCATRREEDMSGMNLGSQEGLALPAPLVT